MIRRLLVAGSVILALAAAPSGALAQDNVSVAENTKDGTNVFDFSFSLRLVTQDVVDQGNAAVAFASCEDCQTVAIAIQVLLVTGDPEVVSPTNLAIAMNVECPLCNTMASAIQIVLGTDGMVRFTGEGRQRLAALRLRLLELKQGSLSLAEIDAALKEIVAELRDVLATELVPVGPEDVASGSPSPAPSGSQTAEPTGSSSPSADTSPSESPAPQASPSESAEPSTSSSPS